MGWPRTPNPTHVCPATLSCLTGPGNSVRPRSVLIFSWVSRLRGIHSGAWRKVISKLVAPRGSRLVASPPNKTQALAQRSRVGYCPCRAAATHVAPPESYSWGGFAILKTRVVGRIRGSDSAQGKDAGWQRTRIANNVATHRSFGIRLRAPSPSQRPEYVGSPNRYCALLPVQRGYYRNGVTPEILFAASLNSKFYGGAVDA